MCWKIRKTCIDKTNDHWKFSLASVGKVREKYVDGKIAVEHGYHNLFYVLRGVKVPCTR